MVRKTKAPSKMLLKLDALKVLENSMENIPVGALF